MTLRSCIKSIVLDFRVHGGITYTKAVSVYLLNPGFRLLLNYRIGNYLANSKLPYLRFLSKYYAYKQVTKRGCQISYKSVIGDKVKFMHPIGIVIGDAVIVGNNVNIWQQVTIGSHGRKGMPLNYPTIEEGVRIFAGAKVFGNIKVGRDATIGANSVVNQDVPAERIAVGIPARIL